MTTPPPDAAPGEPRGPTARVGRSGPPLRVEAVVVGTGFGGAVTACRLAQAGFQVLVVERGRRYEADDFPALPDASTLLPDLRRWGWQQDQGLWDVVDLGEVIAVQAAGYGGGSLIYANVHLRPPGDVFDEWWPEAYRGGAALQGFYDLAAHMLEVVPVSAHPAFHRALVKSDQMAQAAGHLERRPFYPPLAIRYADGPNVHGITRSACNCCGNCCAGCRYGAKNTLDATYLSLAERHGARALTQCEVTGLRDLGDDGWEVVCVDHIEATRLRVHAKYVFLCAGSIHSTRLVARAQLRDGAAEARAAQALAGVGYFPGADAIGIVYDTAHEQFPSFGPTITTALVHWDAERPDSYFLVEDGGYGEQLERIMGALRAPAWVGRNRLSSVGPAAVRPSPNAPPPPAPAAPSTGSGVRPPLDAVLDSIAKGDFRTALSQEMAKAISSFVDELKDPILLPVLVDATLERALRDRYARSWLLGGLDPDGPLLRLLTRVAKWIAHHTLGDAPTLAGHALRAAFAAGDLDRSQFANQILGLTSDRAKRRAMFLCMGRDAAPGVLQYDPHRDRLVADLELFYLASGYSAEERLMTDMARALGGELRINPAWAFLGKPVTVHNQGGCRMSDHPDLGVTTDEGQVRGCAGLYVLDGSILCGSVGTNPSATIMAIAERNVLAFIRGHRGASWPDGVASPGAAEYRQHRDGARAWAQRARDGAWAIQPPRRDEQWTVQPPPTAAPRSEPLGLRFHERMQGYYEPTKEAPRGDARYREHETAGCPEYPIELELDVSVENLAAFFEDERHRMRLAGTVTLRLPGGAAREEACRAEGSLQLIVPQFKPHAIRDPRRREAQKFAAGHVYTTRPSEVQRPKERFMKYDLSLSDPAGRGWRLWGYKRIRREPGIDAWRATSSLLCRLYGPFASGTAPPPRCPVSGAGVVHVDLTTFLRRQVPSMQVTGTQDPARKTWAFGKFAAFFFGSLQRIYVPELGSALEMVLRAQLGDAPHHPSLDG